MICVGGITLMRMVDFYGLGPKSLDRIINWSSTNTPMERFPSSVAQINFKAQGKICLWCRNVLCTRTRRVKAEIFAMCLSHVATVNLPERKRDTERKIAQKKRTKKSSESSNMSVRWEETLPLTGHCWLIQRTKAWEVKQVTLKKKKITYICIWDPIK